MREKSYDYFWNSKNDRYYDADSMGDWLKPFFRNGVFQGQLQVTANDNMSVTVGAGYGYINGKHRHFLTPTTLDLETASGTLHRIDNVILRRDDTDRQIYLMIEKGGNASSPVAPALERKGSIYDMKLAEIYIAAGTVKITQAEITDTRMNAEVCGYVAATVKEIDFTQISAQFERYFLNYKNKITDEFQSFVQEVEEYNRQVEEGLLLMKQTFEDYAGQQEELYQNWITGQQDNFSLWRKEQEGMFTHWYETTTEKWRKDFQEWFEYLRGWFSDDAVGKMQMEIVQHVQDNSNPHGLDKAQIGMGNVDNTSDMDKPVSVAQQAALDALHQQLTGYTDQEIAALIGGAPSTLDTLGEIAQAMQDNASVVMALDEAIGKKASAAEFDSHAKNSMVHITAAERNSWNSKADSGHTHNYAASGHTHDDRYYTEAEINTKLNGKADSGHTHNYAASGHTHNYSDIPGRPNMYWEGDVFHIDF